MQSRILQLAGYLALGTVLASVGGCASNGSFVPSPETRGALTASEDDGRGMSSRQADDEAQPTGALEDWVFEMPVYAKGPVALVGGSPVPAREFNRIVRIRLKGTEGLAPSLVEMTKDAAWTRAIEAHLIENELDAHQIEVSEARVDEGVEAFTAHFDSDEALAEFMDAAGQTRTSVRDDARMAERLKKYLAQNYDVVPTDQEVRAEYESNPERWEHPRRVKARHILVKPADDSEAARLSARKQALELYEQAIASSPTFADTAREYSDGPSAERGGDLGYFRRRQMVEAFSDVAFSMKPGEISKPVETRFGWHIIKVEEVDPAGKTPFGEIQEQLHEELERRATRVAVEKLLTKLKEAATIERLPENIEMNQDAMGEPIDHGSPVRVP